MTTAICIEVSSSNCLSMATLVLRTRFAPFLRSKHPVRLPLWMRSSGKEKSDTTAASFASCSSKHGVYVNRKVKEVTWWKIKLNLVLRPIRINHILANYNYFTCYDKILTASLQQSIRIPNYWKHRVPRSFKKLPKILLFDERNMLFQTCYLNSPIHWVC